MAQNLLQVQQAESCRKIHKLTRFEHQLAAGIGDPKRNGSDEKILVVAQRIVRNVPRQLGGEHFSYRIDGSWVAHARKVVLIHSLTAKMLNKFEISGFKIEMPGFYAILKMVFCTYALSERKANSNGCNL